jgi:hypothetical protein
MRKLFPLLAVLVLSWTAAPARADEEKTITGDAMCAKCALKETDSCQNTITVEESGKKVVYYLAKNDTANKAHKSLGICGASKDAPVKVKATGTVKEEDGKKVLTASKIEKAE